MIDLVIRNATRHDGSGGPPSHGDIRIDGGRIVAFDGRIAEGAGREEVDVGGLAVAPGFIDLHTHYDAQVTWDPLCSFSCDHGATSVVIGNCSLSLAPVRKGNATRMAEFLSYVEAIPMEVLNTIEVDWETFPQYMDRLDRNLGVNVGTLVGHTAVRYYVMGDECQKRAATDDECDREHEPAVARRAGLDQRDARRFAYDRGGEQCRAIRDQHIVALVRPVPFEHGELGMMQRASFAIAEHARKRKEPRLAGRQQLLGGELRRGPQVERRVGPIQPDGLGGEGMQVGLVARRDLQGRRFDLEEIPVYEPGADGRRDPVARQQQRPTVGMPVGRPPGRRGLIGQGCDRLGGWRFRRQSL